MRWQERPLFGPAGACARRSNQEVRSREYLTEMEVTRLAEAAQALGRHGHRDA